MASNIPVTQDAPSAQWSADRYQLDSDANAQQVAAADPQRRSVTVINDPDSAGVMWVTPNAGTRRGGIRLVQGAGYEFATGAPVYAYATGGDVTCNVVCESGASC